MTTDKTKAAMDAFDRLISDVIPMDRHPDSVKSDVDAVRAALTAQAEAQPADDEVREAVKWARQAQQDSKDTDEYAEAVPYLETLIRAATQPQSCEAIPCCGKCTAGKDVKIEYVAPPQATDARKRLFAVRGAILAEIDTNKKIDIVEYWQRRLADLDEALALLGWKEI